MDNEITINGEVYVKKNPKGQCGCKGLFCSHKVEGILDTSDYKDPIFIKPWPQEGDEVWEDTIDGVDAGRLY